ncbi:MAG: hypothetical protein ABII01_05910 [Candidatus Woesearchaeota archaeon]
MVTIKWCCKQKQGIRIVEANDNLADSYIKMAGDATGTMNREKKHNMVFAVSACYYSMYYSLYAVLRKIGVKCEKCPLKNPIKIGETKSILIHGVTGGKTFKITHTGFKLPDGKKAILEFFDDITHICKRHEKAVKPTNQKKYEKATVEFFHKYKDMPTKEELEKVLGKK